MVMANTQTFFGATEHNDAVVFLLSGPRSRPQAHRSCLGFGFGGLGFSLLNFRVTILSLVRFAALQSGLPIYSHCYGPLKTWRDSWGGAVAHTRAREEESPVQVHTTRMPYLVKPPNNHHQQTRTKQLPTMIRTEQNRTKQTKRAFSCSSHNEERTTWIAMTV
jgi:hypothetical protein